MQHVEHVIEHEGSFDVKDSIHQHEGADGDGAVLHEEGDQRHRRRRQSHVHKVQDSLHQVKPYTEQIFLERRAK